MATLLWDQHTCLPLQAGTDVAPLTHYQHPGGVLLSVNAGYSPQRFTDTQHRNAGGDDPPSGIRGRVGGHRPRRGQHR